MKVSDERAVIIRLGMKEWGMKDEFSGFAKIIGDLLDDREELLREVELARGQAYERQEALESADGLRQSYKDRIENLERENNDLQKRVDAYETAGIEYSDRGDV